jgi:hypothetical protein
MTVGHDKSMTMIEINEQNVLGPSCRSFLNRKISTMNRDYSSKNLLYLRGGFSKCMAGICPCLCESEEQPNNNIESKIVDVESTTGIATKSRRVGRMEGNIEINADARKVYRVISDVEHFKDWSGNGLQSVTILERGHSHVVADYICGSFGLVFHFAVHWGLSGAGLS